MNTEMTSPTANLVGRWGLDEGTGSAIADSSGNAVNGTTIDSPGWVDGFNVAPPVRRGQRPAVQRLEPVRDLLAGLSLERNQLHAGDLVQQDGTRCDGPDEQQRRRHGCSTDHEGAFPERQSREQRQLLPGHRHEQPSRRRLRRSRTERTTRSPLPRDQSERLAPRSGDLQRQHVGASTSMESRSRRKPRATLLPQSASSQPAALGTARDTTGAAAGFFQGVLDESRIWNTARSGAQIQAAMNTQIGVPTAGLIGRYGLQRDIGYQRSGLLRKQRQRNRCGRTDVGSGCSIHRAG